MNPSSHGLVLPTRRRDPLVLKINEESLQRITSANHFSRCASEWPAPACDPVCTRTTTRRKLRPGCNSFGLVATAGVWLQQLGPDCSSRGVAATAEAWLQPARRGGGSLEPGAAAISAASVVTSPLAGASSTDDAPASLLPHLRPPAASIPLHPPPSPSMPLHAPPSRTQAADSSRVATSTTRQARGQKIDSMTSVPPAAPSSLGSRLGGGEGLKRSTAFTNALLTRMRFT